MQDLRTKLSLGTVQFGLAYGVSNSQGAVPLSEAKKILQVASSNKVRRLDTAANYGVSEEVLGRIADSGFDVVTKIGGEPSEFAHGGLVGQLRESLDRLNRSKLAGVLLHNASVLTGGEGEEVCEGLLQCKALGLVEKVGVSVYSPDELEEVFTKFTPDIVQVPYNALDRRFEESGWLRSMKDIGVEVQCRSVFLQGLLIMEPDSRPQSFAQWQHIFYEWDSFVENSPQSRVACALQFALHNQYIDTVLVGVQTAIELEEILAEASVSIASTWQPSVEVPMAIVDPRSWSI